MEALRKGKENAIIVTFVRSNLDIADWGGYNIDKRLEIATFLRLVLYEK